MYDYRKCAEPGCERHFIPKSSRNRFCLQHRKTGPVDPMHYRKYGPAHRALRIRLARRVAAGGVECARCGKAIDAGVRVGPRSSGRDAVLRGCGARAVQQGDVTNVHLSPQRTLCWLADGIANRIVGT